MNNLNIYSITYGHLIVHLILINIIISILDYLKINNSGIELFKEYYVENRYKNLIVDFFLIYTYLKIAEFLPAYIPIQFRRLIVTFVIDMLLNFYLKNTSYDDGNINFLKKWSSTVGWFAILWDFILLFTIGTVADKINMIKFMKKPITHIIIFGLMAFGLLHI
jgi:hypothetical protein